VYYLKLSKRHTNATTNFQKRAAVLPSSCQGLESMQFLLPRTYSGCCIASPQQQLLLVMTLLLPVLLLLLLTVFRCTTV
jgi:hypothetical protein